MAGRIETPMVNEKILFRAVQLISADGRNLGVVNRDEALRLAREAGLDLVLLAEKEDEAPIAKIMDYGKASYAKKKQQSSARKKQRVIVVKEVQMSPKIGDHDFRTKMNSVFRFLNEGNHVKIVLGFRRGREAALREQRGAEMYERIDALIAETYGDQKQVLHEKDVKTATAWIRVYYSK